MRFTVGYDGLAGCDLIIVAGADLLINNHLLANRVRETVKTRGARVIVVDPLPAALARIADAHLQVTPGQDAYSVQRPLPEADRGGSRTRRRPRGSKALPSSSASSLPTPCPRPRREAAADEAVEKAWRLIADAEQDRRRVRLRDQRPRREPGGAPQLLPADRPARAGDDHPHALQANARGAAAILAPLASPEEVLRKADMAGIFLYEEDPFQYLNGEMVKAALARKEFIIACDLFPTEATAVAGLAVPAASFAEKEGTVVSGDGTPRAVRKAVAGKPGGPEFLRQLLSRLGGKRYNGDELMGDLIKGLLAKEGEAGEGAAGSTGSGKFLPTAADPAPRGNAALSPHPPGPFRQPLPDRQGA